MKKKLTANKGETLIETLSALLIITLTFVFLVNSITKATQLRKKADEMDVPFTYQAENTKRSGTLTVSGDVAVKEQSIDVYVCANEKNSEYSYYYYEP